MCLFSLYFTRLRYALPKRNSRCIFIEIFWETCNLWWIYLVASWFLIWHPIVFVGRCLLVIGIPGTWSSFKARSNWKCIRASLPVRCSILLSRIIYLCRILVEVRLSLLNELHVWVRALRTKTTCWVCTLYSWEKGVSILVIIDCDITACIYSIWTYWNFRLLSPHVLTSWVRWRLTTFLHFAVTTYLSSHSQKFYLFVSSLKFSLKFFYE